jgi:hypothetical protein
MPMVQRFPRLTVAMSPSEERTHLSSVAVQRRAVPSVKCRGGSRGPQLAPHGELGPRTRRAARRRAPFGDFAWRALVAAMKQGTGTDRAL